MNGCIYGCTSKAEVGKEDDNMDWWIAGVYKNEHPPPLWGGAMKWRWEMEMGKKSKA